MRICRITQQYPRASYPGALLVTYILSERLPFPCLYIAKKWDEPPSVTFSDHITPVFISYHEPIFPAGYNLTRLQTLVVMIGKLFGSMVITLKAMPHIHKFNPDLVHVHTPLMIAPALLSKLLWRKPIILNFHGTDWKRFRTSRLTQWIVRRFVDFVICITPDMLEEFKTLLPNTPAAYVANGVDLGLFTPGEQPKRKQIVTVGRLVWQKGYDHLIKAMALVLQAQPGYRLIIIGDGPLRSELEAAARDAGIAHCVEFTGALSQPEVVRILQASELYVMSSVSEGFPKALVEAMACGLPVVVTDVGACKMLAESAGLVVEPQHPERLAEAVVSLLEDAALREYYARQALEVAYTYGWDHVVQEVRSIYEHVLYGAQVAESAVFSQES